MRLKFTKMHGAGNDFVVLEALARPLALTPQQLRSIADRRFGVGCDQILQVEPPRQPDTDYYYRIFNADGGEVEQCGNGARCFMRYVRDRGLTSKRELRVGTRAGVIVPCLEDDGRVTVDMGVPVFEPSRKTGARSISETICTACGLPMDSAQTSSRRPSTSSP